MKTQAKSSIPEHQKRGFRVEGSIPSARTKQIQGIQGKRDKKRDTLRSWEVELWVSTLDGWAFHGFEVRARSGAWAAEMARGEACMLPGVVAIEQVETREVLP